MYAGSGNKITIKRKNAAVEGTELNQQEIDGTPRSGNTADVKCIPTSHLSYGASSPKKSSKGNKVISFYILTLLKLLSD